MAAQSTSSHKFFVKNDFNVASGVVNGDDGAPQAERDTEGIEVADAIAETRDGTRVVEQRSIKLRD